MALGAPTLRTSGQASALRWPRAPRDPALRVPRGGRTARRSAEGLWPLSAPRPALGTGASGPEKPRRGAPFCARLLILLPRGEGAPRGRGPPALPGAQPCTPEGPVSPLPRGAAPAPPAPAPSPPWPGLRSPLGSEARRPRTPRGRTRPTPTVPAARSRCPPSEDSGAGPAGRSRLSEPRGKAARVLNPHPTCAAASPPPGSPPPRVTREGHRVATKSSYSHGTRRTSENWAYYKHPP